MNLKEILSKYLTEEQMAEVLPQLTETEGKIPKERFDEVNNKYKELKENNSLLEKELNELKSNPESEKLNKELEKLTKKLEEERTKAENHEKEMINKDKEIILKEAFNKFKVKDTEYIKYKLGELDYKDGQIINLEEKLKELAGKEDTKNFFNLTEIVDVNNNITKHQQENNNSIKSIEELKHLTPQEYIARKEEIDTFMANNV